MDGSLQPGVTVNLRKPDGNLHIESPQTSNNEGSVGFHMEGMAPGTYKIEANYPPGSRSGTKDQYWASGTVNTFVILDQSY